MKHGTESFFIKGEGWIISRLFPLALIRKIFRIFSSLKGDSYISRKPEQPNIDPTQEVDEVITKPKRAFCRLFPQGSQPESETLVELGLLMESEVGDPNDYRDSTIPAGYTYLGQFIDHDITMDRTELSTSLAVDPSEIKTNFRTPQLDLDSVYLNGPAEDPGLYEQDRKKLLIGQTTDVLGLGAFPNDLPRKAGSTEANIGDGRNDENLIVAQTHLLFLKFHNSRVDANPSATFEEIRREVTEHYQAIILTDFLPKVVNNDVLNDVIQNGRKFYTDEFKDCMPIEFSVAAYRMGHSMVRPSYEWNKLFNSTGSSGIATFRDIFEFSGVSGVRSAGDPPFRGLPSLPSNWIADWRRMYDLATVSGGQSHAQMNHARKLDAQLALALQTLPEFQQMNPPPPAPMISLSTRNLLRGRLVSLATGQQVACAIGTPALTPGELIQGLNPAQVNVIRKHGFDEETPLWYYILREAMIQENGNRLGRVGSQIVAETLVGLIQNSPVNVLRDRSGFAFSMPELVSSLPVDINPLGD